MRLRLDPADEYPHPPGPEPHFNESVYCNVYDPRPGVGGFLRIGNRANEGYAEVTTCLFLPGGRVAFWFARPPIAGNEAFEAGGMRVEVVEPFRELRFTYEGPVALLEDPLALKDPRAALGAAPRAECRVALAVTGLSPVWGGEPELEEGDLPFEGMEFARGHFEQHVAAGGELRVGAEAWRLEGFGLRDHSWGPRHWQAPLWYRWLTANAGPEHGFMVSVVADRRGGVRRTGVVFERGGYTPITDVTVESTWTSPDRYHREIRCRARTPDRELEIEGRVLSLVPLRHRRGEELTRITEGLTEYRWEGKVGYGLSEYLDQVVDGVPVGQ